MRQYIDVVQDVQGNALVGVSILVQNYVGGGNASIYSDNGLTPIFNSTVTSGSDGSFSFFAADGDYNLVFSKNSTVYKTQSPVSLFDGAAQLTFSDTGTANTYAISNNQLEKALRSGLRISMLVANSNTGASTLQYNGLTAKSIILPGGSAAGLPSASLLVGGIYTLEYDGTYWELKTPSATTPLIAQTAAEAAAGVTPTNLQYPAVPADIRRYGGGNSATASANRTAITSAIAVAAGSDYGYGQAAFELHFPDGGIYSIASGGSFIMPVNMSLVGPSSLIGVTLTLSGTDQIVWRNPANYGGAHTQTQYWPYMTAGAKNVVFTGGYGVLVQCMIGAVFEDCVFSSSTASNPSIELRNTYNYWTERTSFTRCFFGGNSAGDSILFNGTRSQSNPGVADGSFAYTQFDACVVACAGTMNLVRVIDGAVPYGCKWGFRGNFTSTGGTLQGAMFCLDTTLNTAKISEGLFDVRVESGTGLSYLFYLGSGAVFWDNKGQISLPSYDFDSVEINGSFRGNSVEVTGANLYNPFFNYAFNAYLASGAVTGTLSGDWMGGTGSAYPAVFPDGELRTFTLTQGSATVNWTGGLTATQTNFTVNIYQLVYQGQQIPSRIVNSVRAREPVEMKFVDLYHSGVMTAGANSDPAAAGWVLGQMPVGINTILRFELSCSAGSSTDTDALWHLDIRAGLVPSTSAYAGTNSQFALFIPDATLIYNANVDIYMPSLPNYSSAPSFQPVLTSQPTNVGVSHNNGTGPTDLRCRMYYF